jgi:O-methyltransferase
MQAQELLSSTSRSMKRAAGRSVRQGLRTAAAARLAHRDRSYLATRDRYAGDSMIEADVYVANLRLADIVADLPGDIVECGTWRGGMIAGVAERLGDARHAYHLFDSFEGLPPAQEIDGAAAAAYQANEGRDPAFDNCVADVQLAEEAMRRSGVARYEIHRGWFEDTLPVYAATMPDIALLRLDGDWYDSTMACLRALHSRVVPGGLVIIDDYDPWDGCARAVHTFLAEQPSTDRILRFRGVAYLRRPC